MIQKAFKLTVDNIVDEPWHYDDIIVYADSHGEAKSKGLSEFSSVEVEDKKRWTGNRYVEFTDVKAYRIKKLDKVLYEGQYITQEEVEHREWEKDRDVRALKLMQNNPNGVAVVYAKCYNAYWGANRSGYTSNIELAGKYSTTEAYEIVRGNSFGRGEEVILLDINKYNEDIDIKIQILKNNIQKLENCKL